MTFTMVIPRRPVSANQNVNKKFREAVRNDALARMGSTPRLAGSLYARLIWFHRDATTQDVDNIAKPVLDALKGVVYEDDVHLIQCLTCKVDLRADYTISDRNIPADVRKALDERIAEPTIPHVLYVEVGQVPSPRVEFGLIDGGSS